MQSHGSIGRFDWFINTTHSPNPGLRDHRELVNSLLGQKDYLKRELDEKNNIISLLIRTGISYLIQQQSNCYNTKDDVSNENVSSNSNLVISDSISNSSYDINSTNITVNKDNVSDITFVDSQNKAYFLSISEQ